MTLKRTVILALGAAASLFFAPFVIGSLKGDKIVRQEDTMMKDDPHEEHLSDCRRNKGGERKSSCGGEGLNERCMIIP